MSGFGEKISQLPLVASPQPTDVVALVDTAATVKVTVASLVAAAPPQAHATTHEVGGSDPVLVDDLSAGGLTAHGVLVGRGTSPIAATGAGATNTLLHGNTGSDPSFSAVVEADLSLSDVTTDNVSATKHGFAPKANGSGTKFLDDTGVYDGVDLTTDVGATILPAANGGTGVASIAALRAALMPVTESDLSLSDVTTDNVSASKHGFAPKATGSGTKFLDDTGVYDGVDLTTDVGATILPAANGGTGVASIAALRAALMPIVEADLSLSDVTTDNVSSSKHGFAPKANGSGTKFLDDTGVYDGVDLTTDVGATVLPVANGGTGDATLTAHGVLIGEGTSAVTALAAGASGKVLAGQGAADPSFVFCANPATCSAFNSAPQSVPSGAFTVLTLDSTDFDTSAGATMHSTSSNTSRVVAPFTGYYTINGISTFASGGGSERVLRLQVNGTTPIITNEFPIITSLQFGVCKFAFLNAGDYVEMLAFQDSGGNLNVGNASPGSGDSRVEMSLLQRTA